MIYCDIQEGNSKIEGTGRVIVTEFGVLSKHILEDCPEDVREAMRDTLISAVEVAFALVKVESPKKETDKPGGVSDGMSAFLKAALAYKDEQEDE